MPHLCRFTDIAVSLAAALSLAVLAACGGSDSLDAARFMVDRGDLARARGLLHELDGGEVEELLARIDALERGREEVAREADRIAARAPEAPRSEVHAALERLLSEQDDPGAVELVEIRLSRVADVYAEAAVARGTSRGAPAISSGDGPRPPASWVPAGDPRAAVPAERASSGSAAQARASAPESGAALDPLALPVDPLALPVDPLAMLDEIGSGPALPAGPLPASAPVTAEERALALAAAGDLAGARQAWIEAGTSHPPGALREECLGRARDLADRAALRLELGLGAAPAAEWLALAPAELGKRAEAAHVSARARLGLAAELYARGDRERGDRVLERLLRNGDAGTAEIGASEVFWVVARARDETPPESGYIYWDGGWQRPEAVAALELAARIAELAQELPGARPERRDEVYQELYDLGALAELAAAVQARFDRAAGEVARSKALSRLEQLAAHRAELDAARAAALALIFDEERYFHPHDVPEVPPEKAAQYPPVQSEVSDLVAAVQEVWDEQGAVALGTSFLEPLRELLWARAAQAELELSLALPEELPGWVLALPPELEDVDLSSFAWTEEEARELRYSRLVTARNEALFARSEDAWGPDEMPASELERSQVRVTNGYRLMMGRRALAWNPRIQAAAHDHNVWQTTTGRMSHEEDNAEGRSPWDRMRRRGYEHGVSENLAGYGGDATAPHEAWKRSSGHHRNLLMEGHREMASDSSGRYWTQKFGVGTDFEEELAWLD